MDMQELKAIAAKEAVVRCLEGKWFDICAIDTALDIMGMCCKDHDAYQILRSVHCQHYNVMNPAIKSAIPKLVIQVLGGNTDEQKPLHGFSHTVGQLLENK